MKTKYMLSLLALSVLAGCCFNLVGKDFNKCGCPFGAQITDKQTLQNGNTLYTYKKSCTTPQGKTQGWNKIVKEEVSPENIIVKVDTISSCPPIDFDSYVQKYGIPINEYTLQNGNKLYSYRNLCEDKTNWLEYNIEVDQQNEIIIKKNIKSCPIP